MRYLNEQYRQVFAFLRGPLAVYLKNTAITFAVIALVFYGTCLFLPNVRDSLLSYIQNIVDSAAIATEAGGFSALRILENNLRAAAFSVLYGIIPFLFIPALPIGLNAAVLGAMAASYQIKGLSLLLYAAALIPHGIFEFPALFIAFASGLYLCHNATAHVLGKEGTAPFFPTIRALLQVFLLIVIPLLIVASVVEAYITPLFVSLFL